ncbi:MAG: glycosyltransferase, partial [Thermoprotei archaeon]
KAYAEGLARNGFEVSVFMPSSGTVQREAGKLFTRTDGFTCSGARTGADGVVRPYTVEAWQATLPESVRVIAFSGGGASGTGPLDEPLVYSNAAEKASLFCRAFLSWVDQASGPPRIMHSNDWHSGLAAAAAKIRYESRGVFVPWVHSVHLLASPSFPWHYASQDWSGLSDVVHRVWRVAEHRLENVRSVWESCTGNLDRFCVVEADAVVCPSMGYRDTVCSYVGEWVRAKCGVAYNSTDWNIALAAEWAKKLTGTESRVKLRQKTSEILRTFGFTVNLDSFRKLIVSSGRLTYQKGFDILLSSMTSVSSDTALILVGISAGDSQHEEALKKLSETLGSRVALVNQKLGKEKMGVLVYAANVFAVPSRYEPFGVVAIEAQAAGTPVVASDVPGLNEVVDPRSGILVQPENPVALAEALNRLVALTDMEDLSGRRRLRRRAAAWVDGFFRPQNTLSMLLNCYGLAGTMCWYRAETGSAG